MLTLALLRHAKSSWDNPSQDDFDRPLNARGERAAPEVGRRMAGLGFAPDLVLCSTARRTRETLARLLPELDAAPRVRYLDELYLAAPQELLAILRGVPPTTSNVLIVGHNPGLHALAHLLAGSGEYEFLSALRITFPTAALAVITFEASDWSAVAPYTGTLTSFTKPRDR